MNFITGLIVIALVIYFVFPRKPIRVSNWNKFFDGHQFSGKEFYEKVKAGMYQRKIPDVSFDSEYAHESSAVSIMREYLRINRSEYVFYICAAPFGTGMFVSWYLGVHQLTLVEKIPVINTLLGKNRKNKTFYQTDTEAMFRSVVHAVVLEAVDEMTKGMNGIRLTEHERIALLA